MQFNYLVQEKKEGAAWLTLNRPPLNILNIEAMEEVNRALDAVKEDPEVKVVVFAAQGRFFSAGVDIKDHTAERVKKMTEEFHSIFRRLVRLPQPTVALVQGPALGGGCELALSCDLVLASRDAQFGQPEIKVGVFPPIAAIVLPRITERKKALELLLSGEAIKAEEAERLGLVNRVFPPEELVAGAQRYLRQLTGLSGAVLRLTKKAALLGLDKDFEEVLGQVERLYLEELMKTADANEGLHAFLEKRPPSWKNR